MLLNISDKVKPWDLNNLTFILVLCVLIRGFSHWATALLCLGKVDLVRLSNESDITLDIKKKKKLTSP